MRKKEYNHPVDGNTTVEQAEKLLEQQIMNYSKYGVRKG